MEFISHCIKRDPGKLEGRATAGMLIILVILSLLGWIYLTQASYVATTGRRIQDLEAEKARLQQENLELIAEIAGFESVSRLTARARELGFATVALDDAEFLVVADVPAADVPWIQEVAVGQSPGVEASSVARWFVADSFLVDVASQFTAWARAGAE